MRSHEPSAQKLQNLPLQDCEQQTDNRDEPLIWTKLTVINILIFLEVMTLLCYASLPPLNPFTLDGDIKLVWRNHKEDCLASSNHFVIISELTAHSSHFSIRKSQKSHGATSGLYRGCASISIPNFMQKSRVKAAIWGCMLHWCKMNIFKIARHFHWTCSCNFHSIFR